MLEFEVLSVSYAQSSEVDTCRLVGQVDDSEAVVRAVTMYMYMYMCMCTPESCTG